jgi:hypothetical protein
MDTSPKFHIKPLRTHTWSGKRRKPIRQELHCRECGSTGVVVDAYAEWNVMTQRFEISSTYDKGGYCNTCDKETRAVMRPYRIRPPLREVWTMKFD